MIPKLIKWLKSDLNISLIKDDCRKLGVNFITAGVVGIFINHFVGDHLSTMVWAASSISIMGFSLTLFGVFKRGI